MQMGFTRLTGYVISPQCKFYPEHQSRVPCAKAHAIVARIGCLGMIGMGLIMRLLVLAIGVLVTLPGLTNAQDVPRTPWGAPNLQGVWDFRTITPLERPEDVADKAFLTEEEVVNLEKQAVDRGLRLLNQSARRTVIGGNVGAYNDFWMDRGTSIVDDRRTSLIVNPRNGRLPSATEAGEERAENDRGSFSDTPAES